MKALQTAVLVQISAAQNQYYQEQTCYLTSAESGKPQPSLSFCFRSNINACCLTAHDQLISDAYGSYMPGECLNDFPELEFFACLACHFSQPKSTHLAGLSTTQQSSKYPSEIRLCKEFVQRLWGEDDLTKATKKFDSCGLFDSDGNVVIPSREDGYQTALDFLQTIGVPLMGNFKIVIVEGDPEGVACFNSATALASLGAALALLALY